MNWRLLHRLTDYLKNIILIIFVLAYWYNYKNFNSARYEVDTNYLLWTSSLPAFTMCQAENFKYTRFNLSDKFIKAFLYGLIRPKDQFCSGCNKFTTQDFNIPTGNYSQIVAETVATCEQLFNQCSWNGKFFQCCEKFKLSRSKHGICYSMNSEQTTGGCSLLVSHFAKRAELQVSVNFPVQVFIHDPKEVSFVNNMAPIIERTSSLELHYSIQQIISHRSARGLIPERRGCLLPGERKVNDYKVYSESACNMSCEKRKQLNRCGCFHHLFPAKGKIQCDFKGLQCLDKYFSDQAVDKVMGLKNEEARARRRQKQKELLSCVSIMSEEEVKKSHRPKLSLDNNFGWQVVEKTQVGDGSFPHLTGFYEKPDLSGKEFQKVTYVLYMDKGSVVKKDCIVEETEPPVSRAESVWTQPSSVRVVQEPSEIIKPPIEEFQWREPKPKRQRKLIRDFYYKGLRSRSQSKSRSQSPESIASEKKRSRDKSNRRLMNKLTHGKSDGGDSDEPKSDEHGRKKSDKKNRKMISGFLHNGKETKSMESVQSQPSQIQKVVNFERDLGETARNVRGDYENEQKNLQREKDMEKERAMKEIDNKKEKAVNDMELKKERAANETVDKKQKTIDKAKERMDKRNKKFEGWGLRAGASSENVESDVKLEKRTYSLGRRQEKSTLSIRSNQSGLIESVRALPDKFKKPSESLLKTPSGSNKYLYVPIGRRNRSLSRKVIQ